ncbi:MAG: class I SAM-dependent methyltransferase [SAR202 cluster bacterium]|nr:class I SAM-dependent methyltransferase [SAR202 cluster bacterium]|tara:strand:- start:50859 stop:51470 length:612 start_codon:yes stop_codon:yes gene_type:complete
MSDSKSQQVNFFQRIYVEEKPIWEINRPQRAVISLLESGVIKGRVLELGCGTAENAIYLNANGFEVVGIDLSEHAIKLARQKSKIKGASIELICGDLFKHDFGGEVFDTILDSGVFHGFSDNARNKYMKVLRQLARPGGILHLIAWSEFEPGDDGPRRISRHEIQKVFQNEWTDITIVKSIYETNIHADGAAAWLASMTKMSR